MKQILSVWLDFQGVIYFELLPLNTTVDATLYCAQLENLRAALPNKRPGHGKVRLLIDNAKAHIAKDTCSKVEEFRWEILAHPPYSTDLSPSDCHLFRALSHHLRGKKFENEDHLKNDIETFFASKSPDFYEKGINDLVR